MQLIFEVPSNIILKRLGATYWLSSIMLVWGGTTLGMAFVKNFQGLLACRLILGAAESGYVPGIIYVMSKVYKPHEFTRRLALLLCMTAVSSIVSGPIAYGTSFLDGRNGINGWQYLFIVEGAPTIFLGILSFFCLFDDIDQVSWLTDEQKALHKSYTQGPEVHKTVTIKTVFWAIVDWKTVMFSVCYIISSINFISYQVFAPIIIDGFGFPVLTSQLLSAPPSVAFAFSILVGGYLTDKYKNKRGILIAIGFVIAAIGYLLLRILEDRWAKYGSLFIVPLGVGLQFAANVGWSAVNYPDLDTRAVAVAVIIMFGSAGGVIASYLYPSDDKPYYSFGHSFNLGTALMGCVMSLLTSYLLYKKNRKLELDSYVEYGEEKVRDHF
ncbi:hypothetical protein G6F56_001978 [Rhizopus delemar]|uniref:Major facilitator superfamily (MFS) profile domain-containing protein n=1 Tax=Rhizopus stolonifer TaxID=4846 RepID=A0A367KK75_RHIST|nr:hypothetical protein G6F56_001978 [Rhizopus delemar]RCI02550.1 hypothetical protein CU098_010518 [Rhizopus stolonifer]